MTWTTTICRHQLMLRTRRMHHPCPVRAPECRRRLASCFRGCTPPPANLETRCICKSTASGATRWWSRQATNRPGAHTHTTLLGMHTSVSVRPSLRQCAHVPAARRHSRGDELHVGTVLGAPPAHALPKTAAARLTAIPRAGEYAAPAQELAPRGAACGGAQRRAGGAWDRRPAVGVRRRQQQRAVLVLARAGVRRASACTRGSAGAVLDRGHARAVGPLWHHGVHLRGACGRLRRSADPGRAR